MHAVVELLGLEAVDLRVHLADALDIALRYHVLLFALQSALQDLLIAVLAVFFVDLLFYFLYVSGLLFWLRLSKAY